MTSLRLLFDATLRRLRHTDLLVLVAVLVVVAAVWAFVAVAGEVRDGDTRQFDEWLLRSLRRRDDPGVPRGPGWLAEMGRDFTALGGVAFLSLTVAAVAGYLAMARKYRSLALVLAATGGGLLLSTLLKHSFDRPRPEVVPKLSYVSTSSFPSGHSMLSAVVYLTLGALLCRLVRRRRLKFYFLGLALLLTFLVGLSRVYLGVHWPTDVLAGWTAGLAWAVVCWLLAQYLQRRGAVERSVPLPLVPEEGDAGDRLLDD
jgi:undecaprenyl-diphosphatase